MKKNFLLFLIVGLTFYTAHSQEMKDAMRYAQSDLQGTARFTAMSGAFGALGGDLSSINVNPAGSAVFNNNQFATTMGNYDIHNDSNYFRTSTSSGENSFDINQAGGVFVFKTKNPNNNLKKFSMSINYENTNNYDNSLFSAGTSPINSVANYFLSYANYGNNGAPVPLELVTRQEGESISDLYYYLGSTLPTPLNGKYPHLSGFAAQQAMLAYYEQGFIIDAVDLDNPNSNYVSTVRSGGNYHQENSVYSNGYNGKLIFNSAIQYKDFLYIGLNLNSHFTDYVQNTNFYESNNNTPLDLNYEVQSLNFSNSLHTYGSGFSFQLGTIAKLTKDIRVGLSYESPTWYNMTDQLSQRLSSIRSNNTNSLPPDVADPFLINYYAPYDLRTPGSFIGSFAYVFGKTGLFSVDYKYKDYSQTQYNSSTNNSYYIGVNNALYNALGSSNEIRIGAEYRIQNLKLRGGYRFEGSPYNDSVTIGDLNSFSGGLGYNFGFIKLDFSYVHAHNTSQEQFFSQGFTERAQINIYKNNYTMTFTFEM
ncbi:OmpP1/FadL family transporter [Flavobacterium sp. 5]|uniref:OmpP1/FadL family transporter n=1 Tax=Flavobacterium sp. 5 TaxID=2035199 RepID=UPI000C2B8491|nr:outer membrane protein transport protein [Flavobacterium sp. 5]PKB17835.1 long-subunit fatty acid transport protein [Flavobacterium sp. 5]